MRSYMSAHFHQDLWNTVVENQWMTCASHRMCWRVITRCLWLDALLSFILHSNFPLLSAVAHLQLCTSLSICTFALAPLSLSLSFFGSCVILSYSFAFFDVYHLLSVHPSTYGISWYLLCIFGSVQVLRTLFFSSFFFCINCNLTFTLAVKSTEIGEKA